MCVYAQAKALVWQEQVEVLTQALQQANAEKAVLAADKGRLEQEVANLRLQMSVIQKAMESGQLPASAPLALPPQQPPAPASPVHPMVQQVGGSRPHDHLPLLRTSVALLL